MMPRFDVSRIPGAIHRRGGWVLAVLLLATGLLVPTASRVRVEVSGDGLIPPDSPELSAYHEARAAFGSDEVAAVMVEDAGLFTPDGLRRLRGLHDALAALEFVEGMDGVFSTPAMRNVDGVLETGPPFARIPDEANEAVAMRDILLDDPLWAGRILSADGRAVLFLLYLPARGDGPGPEEMARRIGEAVAPFADSFGEVVQTGRPALRAGLMEQLAADQRVILPAAALLIVLLLALTLRSFLTALIPLVNAAVAVAWTLAAMTMLGIPVNALNYIMPALVLVIGATGDVHVIHDLRGRLGVGEGAPAALRASARRIGPALLLAAATTILGFAATAWADLPVLRQFGVASALAMTIRAVVSLLLFPALLKVAPRLFGRAKAGGDVPGADERGLGWASRAVDGIFARGRLLIIAALVVTAFSAFFASRIVTRNDTRSFIRQNSAVGRAQDRVEEKFAGLSILRVDWPRQAGAFADPRALDELGALAAKLATLDGVDSVTTLAGVIERLNMAVREDDAPSLPDSAAGVRQLFLFAHPDDFRSLVTPDFARASINLRCPAMDTVELEKLVAEIRREVAAAAGSQAGVTGRPILYAAGVNAITGAQVRSLGTMMVLLFIIVSGLFLSLRAGLIVVLVNLVPVAMVFGLMGLAGIPLDVGTCMVAAITLGLAVDDTLHLLVCFNREARRLKDERLGMASTLREEALPISATTLALAAGFAVLAFSSFGPVRAFGLLSAGVMLVALLVEMVLTPLLMGRTRIVTLWDVVGLDLRTRLLRTSPFFRGLTAWQARKVILASNIAQVAAGDRPVRIGERGDKLFVVLDGTLEVSVGEGESRECLAKLETGEVFGEMAFVSDAPRTADVTALTAGRLLSLDRPSLESLRRFSPYLTSQILMNLSAIISKRLAGKLER